MTKEEILKNGSQSFKVICFTVCCWFTWNTVS